MSSADLSYDSLKTVIQFLDPNLRIQLSLRSPSIRVTEKVVPLKFQRLSFEDFQTHVNKATYHIGVYRQYPAGYEVPREHQEDNDKGGTEYNLAEHGFRVWSSPDVLTPGDVEIRKNVHRENRLTRDFIENGEEQMWERHIEFYEMALALRWSESGDNFGGLSPDHLILHSVLRFPPDDFAQYFLLQEMRRYSMEYLQKSIQSYKDRLIPYSCRRDGTALAFTPLLQLTVTSPKGVQIYRGPYNIRLQQAMKNLNTFLFGGRREVTTLKALNVYRDVKIIRLPVGVKFKTEQLWITKDISYNLESLKPILSSLPLYKLNIRCGFHEPRQFDHPMLKSAHKLLIRPTYSEGPFLEIFSQLQNKYVTVESPREWDFPVENQIQLIRNWLVNGKEIGTYWEYLIRKTDIVERLFIQIQQQLGGILHSPRFAMIPMRGNQNLKITRVRRKGDVVEEHPKWSLRMKVLRADPKE